RDGYGLQPEAIERLQAAGVRVVVSVDCGIRSQAAARRATELGIDLVITDHHEPEEALPPALAVINPRRFDCPYPDKDLAGVGVALKLVHGLCLKTNHQGWMPAFLKLAAIGTVADVVPLTGENRVIARLGLERLARGPNTVGLQALLEVCGLARREKIGSEDVGFMLAPRVNAAGRMNTPDLAARLLLTADRELAAEARELAGQLDAENLRRREEEAAILRDARRRIMRDPDIAAQNALVVWGEEWHRGVIGIVASKLVDQFCRPVVVLAVDGDVAYGSGRSIPGFDLLQALEHCADLFTRFGGHRQAAGLELPAARLADLRQRLAQYANERLEPDDLAPRLAIDAPLPLTGIDSRLMEKLNALEPFGVGNRRPVFHAEAVEVVDGPRVIKDRHLAMTVRQGRARFRAMAWRAAEQEEFVRARRGALDVAFSLTENTWRNETSIELSVADVK
ncbi:MAG: single-stranded-DNA-specific exonuclease RecJ, partial [Acidobacteria bacterium]|nr:single-stranded-DNA-specific exonuclease RecJ [Acidobacteriota bacterium]